MSTDLVPVGSNAATTQEGGVTGKGFAKGQSGNPSGRPKGTAALAQRIRRETKEGRLVVDFLLDRMQHGRGDHSRIEAAALLLAYGFGKPVQPTEHIGEGGGPVVFRVMYADDVEP